jgi:hypothetical protein
LFDICEDALWALTGESAVTTWGTVPFAELAAAWKGNSPGSFVVVVVDNGEPVGAERMILGPPFDGEVGMCISSVSCAFSPTRRGDRSRRGSLPSAAVGATARELRPIGEPSDSGVSAMSLVGEGSGLMGDGRWVWRLRRAGMGSRVLRRGCVQKLCCLVADVL